MKFSTVATSAAVFGTVAVALPKAQDYVPPEYVPSPYETPEYPTVTPYETPVYPYETPAYPYPTTTPCEEPTPYGTPYEDPYHSYDDSYDVYSTPCEGESN